MNVATDISRIRARLARTARWRNAPDQRSFDIDRLLDEWIRIAGVPPRPATGWPSEHHPSSP